MPASNRAACWGALAALAVFALPAAAEEKKPANPLEPFARFVGGAWVGKGKGPGPTSAPK